MMTGQLPARHGILSNTPLDPFDLTNGGWYYYSGQIKAPTLWDAVRKAGKTVGSVSWPVTVGAGIDFNIPEYRPIRSEDDLALLQALSTSGLFREYEAQNGPVPVQKFDDRVRAQLAAFIFTKHKPDLMLVHLIDLDHAEHVQGPGSAQAVETLESIDADLGLLKHEVESAVPPDSVTWVIVSDHGFQAVDHLLHPKVLLRALGLLTYSDQEKLSAWKIYPRMAGGSVGFVAQGSLPAEEKQRFLTILRKLAEDSSFGILKIYDEDELRKRQAFSDTFVAVEMRPGFAVGSATSGSLVTGAPELKGTHGYSPTNPHLFTSLILNGAGISCRSLPQARLIDVAPTIAEMLKISFPASEGKSLLH
jgi:predicted AlkP superfamily pyrophosphatase or phosphodiesterase